jgi:hypothetical protein
MESKLRYIVTSKIKKENLRSRGDDEKMCERLPKGWGQALNHSDTDRKVPSRQKEMGRALSV